MSKVNEWLWLIHISYLKEHYGPHRNHVIENQRELKVLLLSVLFVCYTAKIALQN